MALVSAIERKDLERETVHKPVRCTYSIVRDSDGHPCLQLDTYGSDHRLIKGKKSQSLRFTPEALDQLVQIAKKELRN